MRRILSVLLVSSHGVSFACSCIEWKTVSQRRDSNPVAAHVRILSKGVEQEGNRSVRKFTVAVIRDYSTIPILSGDTTYFWSKNAGTSCDFDLPAGEEAILFGDTAWFVESFGTARPENVFSTSLCSQNVLGTEIGSAAEELSAGVPLRPIPPSERESGPGKRILSANRFLFGGRFGADGRCASDRAPAGPAR